jgi:hypothetical protein
MFCAGGTGGDPLLQKLLLSGGQRVLSFRRWHHEIGVGMSNTTDQFAVGGLSGNDGRETTGPSPEAWFVFIESQFGLPAAFISPVTAPAMVGKNWANIAVVVDLGADSFRGLGALPCCWGREQDEQRQGCEYGREVRHGSTCGHCV